MRTRQPVLYWTGFSIILVLLIVAPLVLPEFWRRFLTEILIWGLLAMSSDLLIGYTGLVSFGHSAFFGLGMYGAAAALLTVRPPSLWLALVYGLIAAAIFISLLEAYASLWVSPAQAVIVSFVVLILTLLFRPTGLFVPTPK